MIRLRTLLTWRGILCTNMICAGFSKSSHSLQFSFFFQPSRLRRAADQRGDKAVEKTQLFSEVLTMLEVSHRYTFVNASIQTCTHWI